MLIISNFTSCGPISYYLVRTESRFNNPITTLKCFRNHTLCNPDISQCLYIQKIENDPGIDLFPSSTFITIASQKCQVDSTQSQLVQRRKEIQLSQTSLIIVFGIKINYQNNNLSKMIII